MQIKKCVICSVDIHRPKGITHDAWKKRKTCSVACRVTWMQKEKIGFQVGHNGYKNSGQFMKGRDPWNKGLKGRQPWQNITGLVRDGSLNKGKKMSDEQKKKISEALKNKKQPWRANELHYLWKGDDVGYSALHRWLSNHFTKSNCEFCGSKHNLDWANISNTYKRDKSDFLVLCRRCHIAFDKGKELA